jgi:phage-related baseplate assembly protein
MSSFTAIDLSLLPPPSVVEKLSFETIFSQLLVDLQTRDPSFTALVESDPAFKILEVFAYRELLLRQRINDASRAVMLAYAIGSDLDQIGALFGVVRFIITPADPDANPPIPLMLESDTEFRRRIQLSLEGFSTAGPEGAYVYWGLSADPDVRDISATSPTPGNVLVSVLSRSNGGVATPALLTKVAAVLNSDMIRPLTDLVTVQAITIVNFVVQATIYTYNGPDSSVVLASSQKALNEYLESVMTIGKDVTLSGLYAALHQPGVQRVALAQPTANVVISSSQASFCTAKNITFVGSDD